MPGKFPVKQVGTVPAKGGMSTTKVVCPVEKPYTMPAMRPEMKATKLTSGKRRPGKDG